MSDSLSSSQSSAQALRVYLAGVRPDEPFALGPSPLPDDPILELMQDPFEWRTIPGGTVRLEGIERPFECKSYLIARYPVTFPHFHRFILADDGYHNDAWWEGLAGHPASPAEQKWQIYDHPRENVSWYEAVAFTRWLTHKVGYDVRLPNEWEWQWAAQGPTARPYPWGDSYRVGMANTDEFITGLDGANALSKTTAVDRYPKSRSEFGVVDMAGNVCEWCLNSYEDPLASNLSGEAGRAVRGGSFKDDVDAARTTSRSWLPPDTRSETCGLRIAAFAPRTSTLIRSR